MRAPTFQEYTALYEKYILPAVGQPVAPDPDQVIIVDQRMQGVLEDMFFEGHDSSRGRKCLAAFRHFWPWFAGRRGLTLPFAEQTLKGWTRINPPLYRLPLPFELVLVLLATLLEMDEPEAVLRVALSVHA